MREAGIPNYHIHIGIIFAAMEMRAFSIDEANEICEDFEDLIDTEIVVRKPEPKVYLVDHVVPVPFSAPDKEAYMTVYNETLDPKVALGTYTGAEFDVFIICQYIHDSTDVVMLDIHTYIDTNGVSYNFPDEY